ncbi:tetratricopeptide repeat protein [Oscillatoria sp. FACHB-1406]|uniref:tetratricopeptide repeat protein n=1 Tax=Oscillatoria sp. FACHB-1406 TaxID=2692846 RepID=UPI0016820903|nr:tetratricopeptide repeat protein [Oscillatoria sp. FACHB-1406]MBD2578897.1 tetratricopeptide repeat protein [Oscillatoria sp. FACHB-1406]
MSSETQEAFQQKYRAGKEAFERGQYRLSIEQLETACALSNKTSRLGGEAQLWLVTAYQAANQTNDAIALLQTLQKHPNSTIRHQARRVLEIIRAPALKRPKEWMTEIPDLANLSDSDVQNRYVTPSKPQQSKPEPPAAEPVDLSQVDTKDNNFIWLALVAIALLFGALFFLQSSP